MKCNRYMDTIRAQEREHARQQTHDLIGEICGAIALFGCLFSLYFALYALGF